jgi:hypothetical protein
MNETGELLYTEDVKQFKKRKRGFGLGLFFLNFALFIVFLNAVANEPKGFFSPRLLMFIPLLIVPILTIWGYININQLIIFENCFQPPNASFFNFKLYNEKFVYFSNILVVKFINNKDSSIMKIYTKSKRKYEIWNFENRVKDILFQSFIKNNIKIVHTSNDS